MAQKSKIYVFIDGENLFKSFRAMGYRNVDYVKFYRVIANKEGSEEPSESHLVARVHSNWHDISRELGWLQLSRGATV